MKLDLYRSVYTSDSQLLETVKMLNAKLLQSFENLVLRTVIDVPLWRNLFGNVTTFGTKPYRNNANYPKIPQPR